MQEQRSPVEDGVTVAETFAPELSSLTRIRSFLRAQGAASRLSAACTEDLVLATSEAASNAILHADGTKIDVIWAQGDGSICVDVLDDGVFLRRVRSPGDVGGRGISLMIALMDEVSIREGTGRRPGTHVRLIKFC
jgi:anti-sigma regulatory factor (Ser/Thr protein kinase)